MGKKLEDVHKLYRINKNGSIQQYIIRVYTYDAGAILETSYGVIDGSIQTDLTPIYPKNVGRANETTPLAQAQLQAESKAEKLLDKSYCYADLDDYNGDAKAFVTFLQNNRGKDQKGRYFPMLAGKDTLKIKFPCYVQRKYDGMRNLSEPEGLEITCRSRKGKNINIQHIKDELKSVLVTQGLGFDGELYLHGCSLQQIVSMAKNTENPDHGKLQYRVYDIFGDKVNHLPFEERLLILKNLLKGFDSEYIVRAMTYKVNTMEELIERFVQFRGEGYEGAIARDPNGIYEYGTRSNYLIKVKDFQEEEFELVDMEEATGRDEGTAIFILKTEDGLHFNSRPVGTRELRRWYLLNKEDLIGKMVTVRYQHLTDDGKPAQSRAIIVRDYE